MDEMLIPRKSMKNYQWLSRDMNIPYPCSPASRADTVTSLLFGMAAPVQEYRELELDQVSADETLQSLYSLWCGLKILSHLEM